MTKDVSSLGMQLEEEATLPLRAARSAVYWPHRNTTSLSKISHLSCLLEVAPSERLGELAAAVACVLFRYTQAGTIRMGARGPEGRLHRLVFSIDLRTCIRQVVRDALTMMADREFALNDVPEEGQRRNPGFAVIVAMSGAPLPDTRQDVSVILDPIRPSLDCEYSSRLFDEETIQRFLNHVASFIHAATSNKEARVGDIAYLDGDELASILAITCPPPSPFPREATVQGLFVSAARATPDAPAIEFGDRTVRYGELDSLSSRVAGGLIARGVNPGASIGICIRPSIEQIVVLIAVLRLGAIPVPLDYTFPLQRLQAIAGSARLTLLVAEDNLAAQVAGLASTVPMTATLEAGQGHPSLTGSADDLVYKLFTSGSTGIPKGVAMRQRSIVNLVTWQNQTTRALGQRTLNRSSIAFDVGFQEIFSTLCFGGLLVIASEDHRADIAALLKLMVSKRISRIFIPPVALVQLAELFDEQSADLSSLRRVVVSGERLNITPSIVRMFRTCAATVTNQYGPTETHVATAYDLPESSLKWPLCPPIGRPIANARVHVLDGAGHICPFAVIGEIAIGGELPAQGYINDADETARHFVPDRFPAATAGAKMYLTGDLGRLSPTGELEFVGRKDDQVKLRGYRIELGDIESHALELPGVKLAAAALKRRGHDSDPLLALYIELRSGATLQPAVLQALLAESLPRHMVPALGAILICDALPLNTNGKVDRARLPDLGCVGEEDEAAVESLAEKVATIWKRHLRLDVIGLDDDFTLLGGHSLTAIQIVSRTNQAFGINVPLVTLLRGSSLRQFTDAVARLVKAKSMDSMANTEDAAVDQTNRSNSVPLPNGMTIEAPYPAEARHFHAEVFDRQVYLRGGVALRPRATVVDVGANVGLFTLFALERSKDARVVAIEPAPILAHALRRNTASAGGAVEILEYGLSDRDGRAAFTYYPLLTGMSSLLPDALMDRKLLTELIARERANDFSIDEALSEFDDALVDSRMVARTIEVEVRRLSTVMAELKLETIDLLKIDVQRGEDLVLAGVDPSDWRRIGQVVVEHQDLEGSGGALAARLAALGYSVITEQDPAHAGTNVVYTYAVRWQ